MKKTGGIWLGCLLIGGMIPALASADAPRQAPVAAEQNTCRRPGPAAAPADDTRLLERYLHLLAACVECEDNFRARVRALSVQQ